MPKVFMQEDSFMNITNILKELLEPTYKQAAQHWAKLIFLGATLTKEELKKMVVELEKMLDRGDFEEKDDEPLTLKQPFSSNFLGYNFVGQKTMKQILEKIEDLIRYTGKAGDKKMEYLLKTLKQSRDWNVKFEGLDSETAKTKAFGALDFLSSTLDKIPENFEKRHTVSPEELKEMQQLGVI
jgi:hypothetical protein